VPGDDAGPILDPPDEGIVDPPDNGVVDPPDTGVVDPPDAGPPATPPVLVSMTARQVGRFGDDLRIDVVGHDLNGDATSLDVTFLDAAGDALPLYDANGDGVPESGRTFAALAVPIAGTSDAPAYVAFSRLHSAHPEIASVRVMLVDSREAPSASMDAAVVDQPVLALDALCDRAALENRCAEGLGCRAGVPAVCVEGVAPGLTRVAYLTRATGADVLIEGTDADDDLSQYEISFFDAAGAPLPMDLDGDGTAESVSFAADARDTSVEGAFFYQFAASQLFADSVPRVSVVARDRGDRTSAAVIANRAAAPARSVGQTCDARGFDTCGAAVCSPGTVGAVNHCVAVSAARTDACAAAPTLDLSSGAASVSGDLREPSLWDAPASCSSGDPTARPEALVRFVLAAPASRVVLSTNNAYTNFDSTLYAFAGCAGRPIVAWCVDDRPSSEPRAWLATLELADLPAGEYFVVVDSFAPAIGRFRLDATVTP
jgi:hypothetical protein